MTLQSITMIQKIVSCGFKIYFQMDLPKQTNEVVIMHLKSLTSNPVIQKQSNMKNFRISSNYFSYPFCSVYVEPT